MKWSWKIGRVLGIDVFVHASFLALIAWVFHPGFHVSLAVGVIAEVIGLAILETLPVELTGFILLLVSAVLFVLDVKARAHGVLTAAAQGDYVTSGFRIGHMGDIRMDDLRHTLAVLAEALETARSEAGAARG